MAIEEGPPARALVKQAPSWVVQAFTSTVILLLLLLRQQLFSPFSFLPRSRSKLSFSCWGSNREASNGTTQLVYIPTYSLLLPPPLCIAVLQIFVPFFFDHIIFKKKIFSLLSNLWKVPQFWFISLLFLARWWHINFRPTGLQKRKFIFSTLIFRDVRQHHHSCFLVMHWFYYCVAFYSS